MGNRKSLGRLITKYAVFELLYTFCIVIFFALLFHFLVSIHVIYPANYGEKHLEEIEADFQKESWSKEDIPFYYDYRLVENGKTEQTIDDKYEEYIEKAVAEGTATANGFITRRVFVHFQTDDKDLVLSYTLSSVFASEKWYRVIENFELTYYLLVLILWVTGFALLVRRSIGIIKEELSKVSRTNAQLKEMNLDYPHETSAYMEISDLLSSLDGMSKGLKLSLNKQWTMQERQRELVESITHDIRTPITIIKGNLELLGEDAISGTEERIQDIKNGVDRLETYINRLTQYESKEPMKEEVRQDTIRYWISVIETICKANDRNLIVEKTDSSNIFLEREAIAIALQNVTINSVENSEPGTTIRVSFINEEDRYKIEMIDEGRGFPDGIIGSSSHKHVTSKKQNPERHGLGLYIVEEALRENKGELILENQYEDKGTGGAKVTFLFEKSVQP